MYIPDLQRNTLDFTKDNPDITFMESYEDVTICTGNADWLDYRMINYS